jgi:hypothetical protein
MAKGWQMGHDASPPPLRPLPPRPYGLGYRYDAPSALACTSPFRHRSEYFYETLCKWPSLECLK